MRFFKSTLFKITIFCLFLAIFVPVISIQAKDYETEDIFVDGDYAYTYVTGRGLQIIDVSDPLNPQFAGHIVLEGYRCSHIFAVDNYVYVAFGFPIKVYIINVLDPSNPVLERSISSDVEDNTVQVFAIGDFLYIVGGDVLVVYDISNPTSSSKELTYSDFDVNYVFVTDNKAYLACETAGLVILDVTTPNSPVLLGNYTESLGRKIVVEGNYGYLFCWKNGIGAECHILDISNPSSISLLGYYTKTYMDFALIEASKMYYARGGYINVVGLSNPGSPLEYPEFYLDTGYAANGLFVKGDYAFTTSNYIGLVITDVSNPYDLSVISTYTVNIPAVFTRNIILIVVSAVILLALISLVVVQRKQLQERFINWKQKPDRIHKATLIALISSIIFIIFSIVLGIFIFFYGEWYTGLCIFFILVPLSTAVLVFAPLITWIIVQRRR